MMRYCQSAEPSMAVQSAKLPLFARYHLYSKFVISSVVRNPFDSRPQEEHEIEPCPKSHGRGKILPPERSAERSQRIPRNRPTRQAVTRKNGWQSMIAVQPIAPAMPNWITRVTR